MSSDRDSSDTEEEIRLQQELEALKRTNRILELCKEKARMQRLNAALQTEFGSPSDGPPLDNSRPPEESERNKPESHNGDTESTLLPSPDDPYEQPPSRSRLPSVYSAKLCREFTEFIDHCELTFSLSPSAYRSKKRKAYWASQYIQGRAWDDWKRHWQLEGEEGITWPRFREVMELVLGDPETRGRARLAPRGVPVTATRSRGK